MQPVYRSTDTGAPTLSNTNGSLVDLLDAVLVNGYGSQASLGWSIAHTGTNKRVYQQGAGSGFCLRVDDSANAYNAAARGGESFSDVDTYSGGFPTAAQLASGDYIQKTNNGAGTRAWALWGDAKRFVMFVDVHGTGNNWNAFYFGDFVSFKAGDAYNCIIMGKHESRNDTNSDFVGAIAASMYGSNISGNYIARAYTGIGSAIQCSKYADGRNVSGRSGQGSTGSNILPYPDPISGGLHLSRFFISENAGGLWSPRGYVPGIWCVNHDRGAMAASGVANGDTFNGSDGLASRSFEYRYCDVSNGAAAIAVETSDWPESA